jgi:hypothetical protein
MMDELLRAEYQYNPPDSSGASDNAHPYKQRRPSKKRNYIFRAAGKKGKGKESYPCAYLIKYYSMKAYGGVDI